MVTLIDLRIFSTIFCYISLIANVPYILHSSCGCATLLNQHMLICIGF